MLLKITGGEQYSYCEHLLGDWGSESEDEHGKLLAKIGKRDKFISILKDKLLQWKDQCTLANNMRAIDCEKIRELEAKISEMSQKLLANEKT